MPPLKPDAKLRAESAERALIGCNLRAPETIDPDLRAADFVVEVNARIFAAILACQAASRHVDVVTVSEQLQRDGFLEAVGGPLAIQDIAREVGTTVGASFYAEQIRDAARFRQVLSVVSAAIRKAEQADSWQDALERVETSVLKGMAEIRTGRRADLVPVGTVVPRVASEVEAVLTGQYTPGVSTGLEALDRRLSGGPRGGEVIVLAGRASMGKTATVVSIARNVAARGGRVAYFVFEMTPDAIVQRLLAMESGIDLAWIRSPAMRPGVDETLARFSEATAKVGGMAGGDCYGGNLLVMAQGGCRSLSQIRSAVNRAHTEGPLSLVIVDYVQQVVSERRGDERREREVAEAMWGLKEIATELKAPVLAVAQLNRGVESRTDKRPMLSDLRESGSIEQDADAVVMLYRDEYYNPNSEKTGIIELIVAKNRNGETGPVECQWDAKTTTVRNLARTSFPERGGGWPA